MPLGDPAAHPPLGVHTGMVLAVAHHQLMTAMAPAEIGAVGVPDGHVLSELEYVLGRDESDLRL